MPTTVRAGQLAFQGQSEFFTRQAVDHILHHLLKYALTERIDVGCHCGGGRLLWIGSSHLSRVSKAAAELFVVVLAG